MFTRGNWNAPQIVTVTGVDDELGDGSQPYMIVTAPAVSDDADYAGLDADDVSVTNIDDDTAGITVAPVSGLMTSESGATAQFTVVLNSKPNADVAIALATSNALEGTPLPT